MRSGQRQSSAITQAWYFTALASAAATGLASVVLALLWFSHAAATEPSVAVAPEQVMALVQASAEDLLGVAVALEPVRQLKPIALPPGAITFSVRYPRRSGLSLPEAVECRVDGRLATSIPLGQYVRFRLHVLVTADGIAPRTLVDEAPLLAAEQLLNAGAEVATLPAQVAGLATRGWLPAGSRVVLSRLMRPYDVARGSTVLLVIAVAGVRLEARATALADGYTGQRLAVQRDSDKRKYIGLVCAGQRVVVQ